MLYRPPSRGPITAWAKHLDQVMRDRDWSRVRLFEEVGAELGYGAKSRSAFLPLLVDKEPTPEQAIVLASHFGWPPEPAPEPATATQSPDPYMAVQIRVAEAIEALVAELRLSRAAQVEATEVAFRALGALGVRLDQTEMPPETEPGVPAGTGQR